METIRRIVFVVDSDPRSSARAAEAIRIAAGVATWKTVEVSLYLRGAAVLAIAEISDDLIDSENYLLYLPILGEVGRRIYVQKNSAWLVQIGKPTLAFQEMDDLELANLTAASDGVVRF